MDIKYQFYKLYSELYAVNPHFITVTEPWIMVVSYYAGK